jgi:hypothetical protein
MRQGLLALSFLAAACNLSTAQTDVWSPIELTATPIQVPAQAGSLQGRVGFVLESPQARFGGVSDLHVFEDGRLLAITDGGEWLLADLVLHPATGLPTGVVSARMALMRDERGEPFPDKDSGDAEDLAILPDGRVAVSFEQSQSIRIYDLFGAGPSAAAQAGPSLAGVEDLNGNRGLEALALLPSGELLLGAEMGRRGRASPVWRLSLTMDAPAPPISRLRTPPGYGLTAWDWDPTRDQIVAVERFFAPGIGLRIRLVAAALPNEGRALQPAEIATLRPPQPMDNLEGLSIQPLPEGGSRLFLMADDNYSEDQQTLLLVFDWVDADGTRN